MTLAIVGRTGSGKSFTAKGLIEADLAAGERVCVVDPTGAWWGLRLSADGLAQAYPVVIFGGDHADVPILPEQGDRLGEWIATGRARQSVADVSDMSGAEMTRFLTAFLERLYTANRAPLRLVLDEADVMAPQNPLPEQRRLQGATNKIVRRGRIKGFRPILITQRPAVLDKSVLSQIDTLIAMRLTSPQDRRAIEEWVKGNADAAQARKVLDTLASLKRGEGWFWAPHEGLLERRLFPAIQTFDSSRDPEPGEAARDVAPLALPDLDALREAFAVETPKDKPTTSGDVAAARKTAYDEGYADGARAERARVLDEVRRSLGDLHALIGSSQASLVAPTRPEPLAQAAPPAARRAPRPASAGAELNAAGRKMLAVLDTNPPVARSWTQAATLAGLKARGGHFNAGRKALLDAGLVREDGALVRIAVPSAGAGSPASDPAALVDLWCGSLSGAAPKILRRLFEVKRPVSRDEIARQLGIQPRGGHWNAAWKELRDNAIVALDGNVARLTELFRP